MADGLFLVGTDRDVGKTIVGVGIVGMLKNMGVDATLMTPISTGGSVESAARLLKQIGVDEPRHLVSSWTRCGKLTTSSKAPASSWWSRAVA